MADADQQKILVLLDLLAVQVAETREELRDEIGTLRHEVRSGFERVDRRMGRLETRVESIKTEQRSFRREFERRIAPLER